MKSSQNAPHSFSYGFFLSILTYLLSSFLFFWFAVFRRMAVLNIPLKFDSEVYFAMVIIPLITAIPWLPAGLITGFISWKKGTKIGLKAIKIFSMLITIGLLILFWYLPYN